MARVVVPEIVGYLRIVERDILRVVALVGVRGGVGVLEPVESLDEPRLDTHFSASLNSEHSSSYISRASV